MNSRRFSCFRGPVLAPPDTPGSTPPASPGSTSPSPPSGGAPSSGVTPPGSTVAPGVEPPPGAPGSTVQPSTPSAPDSTSDFMSIFDGPAEPGPVIPGATAPPTPATTSAPAAVTPPTPAPAATPAAAEPPADATRSAADGGQPPAATPQPSGTTLDPYDPGGLARAIQSNEAATVDHVAATLFQLSQEDLQGLETDIAATVPKLFARAFVKSQVNQLLQLSNIIPEMVRRATSDMRNHSQNEDAFYSKWPQIDRQKHGELVKRFGITYRQLNPTVSRDEMIDHVGQLVLMAAKLPVTASTNGTAPAASANGRAAPHQPSPFTPAVPGPAAVAQLPELNSVEAMFQPRE